MNGVWGDNLIQKFVSKVIVDSMANVNGVWGDNLIQKFVTKVIVESMANVNGVWDDRWKYGQRDREQGKRAMISPASNTRRSLKVWPT